MFNLKSFFIQAGLISLVGLGAFILHRFSTSQAVTLYVVIVVIVILSLPILARKYRYQVVRDNLHTPAKLQNYHDELLALGFERENLILLTHFGWQDKVWIYKHQEELIYAFANETTGSLWFSSYLEKGFIVTTRFQKGRVSENRKMTGHIVKTSIVAAYDYHLQHRQEYQEKYGNFLSFEKTEDQIEWEDTHNVGKEIGRTEAISYLKLFGRFIAGGFVVLGIAFLMAIPISIFLYFNFSPFVAEAMLRLWSMWFSWIGIILAFLWAAWPYFFPKTVEERKKKEILN